MLIDQFEEAALLYLSGFHPADVRLGPDRGRVVFEFSDDPEVKRLVEDHRDERATVNSARFVDAMKWARKRVHQTRDASGARVRPLSKRSGNGFNI